MIRILSFSFLIFFTSLSFASNLLSVNDSIGVSKINDKLHIRYLVSPGETIYGISTKYGVAVTDLLEINPELENGLKVGQVINIPYRPELIKQNKKENTDFDKLSQQSDRSSQQTDKLSQPTNVKPKPENAVIHKVQAGETLYSLAKKYGVSVNDLLKWNNIDLKVGQEIIVSQKDESIVSSTPNAPPTPAKAKPEIKKIEETKTNTKPEVKAGVSSIPTSNYNFDPSMKQVLIIPFDPYLYFSDADDEIAARSNIPRTKVRQIFRKRLNALLDHPAYENIHLLGGRAKDSLTDMNKIYSSVTYNYQDILYNPDYHPKEENQTSTAKKTNKSWLAKQKEKIKPSEETDKSSVAVEKGKYFGVIIKNPDLFTYFNTKYSADYYIFINQFEVKTNYENCLDRAAQNYERTFTTHFSIFDYTGKQIAGNKFKTHYNSNSNDIYQIVGDNMQKIADRILAELPSPSKETGGKEIEEKK